MIEVMEMMTKHGPTQTSTMKFVTKQDNLQTIY